MKNKKAKIPKFDELKKLSKARPKVDKLCYNRVLENCIEEISKQMLEFCDDEQHYISVDLFDGIISRKYTAPDGETPYEEYNNACWDERKRWAKEHKIHKTCIGRNGTYIVEDNNPIEIGTGIQVDALIKKEKIYI